MNKQELEALSRKAAKGLKTEADVVKLSSAFRKTLLETMLEVEMDEQLGYSKHEQSNISNSRNGYSSKKLKTGEDELLLETPRDQEGSFEPAIVNKHQTRMPAFNDKVLSLYAKGMTTREITQTLLELYDVEVSPAFISKVTDAVMEQLIEWQSRPLDAIYPIVYLDGIVVKIRQDKQVINKVVYLTLGVNLEGQKELLGLWLSENGGAKFWLNVLTELHNRGVKDILIACIDGLKGFPDAITTVFPKTQIQLCIIRMLRHSLKYISWKDYKQITAQLKQMYQSTTEEEALHALEQFAKHWDDKYPQISRSWHRHWNNLNTLFRYPEDIRKAIYTTHAIESLNSVIRKPIKKRKLFPTDDAAKKIIYLAIRDASRKCSMPIRN